MSGFDILHLHCYGGRMSPSHYPRKDFVPTLSLFGSDVPQPLAMIGCERMFETPRQFILFAIALLIGMAVARFVAAKLAPPADDPTRDQKALRWIVQIAVIVVIAVAFGWLEPHQW